jgi:hypothetical protein
MQKIILFILFIGLSFCACKKKAEPETITFDYAYPEISFLVGDSCDYGSTTAGWNYITLEKMDNRGFLELLTEKNIYSKDVSDARLTSCVLNIASTDSTFDLFDTISVKIGGTFSYQGQIYVSGTTEVLIAEITPIAKNGLKQIDVTSLNMKGSEQMRVDPNLAFKIKCYSAKPYLYYTPPMLIKANLTFKVTGTTH